MSIENMMERMFGAPDPANEVVVLSRMRVEAILAELEATEPMRTIVIELRAALAEPKVELWAIHSVGPGEVYPALDHEHAVKMVADMDAACQCEKQRWIDEGKSLEHWCDWVTNIIPSPWQPDEHFEVLAGEALDEEQRLRDGWIKSDKDRGELITALEDVISAWSSQFERNGHMAPEWAKNARDTLVRVNAEEVARKARLAEYKERLAAAGDSAIARINDAEGDKP